MTTLLTSFFSKLVGLHLVHAYFADDNIGHLDFDPILRHRMWHEDVFCDVYANCPIAVSKRSVFSCPYVLETVDSVRRDFEQQLYGLAVLKVKLDARNNSLHVFLENDYLVSVIPDNKNDDYGSWALHCETIFKGRYYVFWKNGVDVNAVTPREVEILERIKGKHMGTKKNGGIPDGDRP